MGTRFFLLLILCFSVSVIASENSGWNVLPAELVRLKNSGATESMIQTKVEEQRQFLKEKSAQAQHFQFTAKAIPSAGFGYQTWSIVSGPEILLKLRDSDGYLSTKTRAEVVVRQLNRALLIGNGQFTSVPRNQHTVILFQNFEEQLVIASVSEEDARFLQSTVNQIADEWSAELNDYWNSLPAILRQPLPPALTLSDLALLAKTSFADRTLLSFFQLRGFDRTIKAEQIQQIGFSKEVTEYLERRILIEAPDQRHRWEYWGSNGYCGYSSTSVSTTISFGNFGKSQQLGSRPAPARGVSIKGASAGLPGRTSNHNR